jgi:hypothetical protein
VSRIRRWPIVRCLRGCDPLTIRTRARTGVLISETSVRYLRDTSPGRGRRETREVQAHVRRCEWFVPSPENRGVPGSSPGLAIHERPAKCHLVRDGARGALEAKTVPSAFSMECRHRGARSRLRAHGESDRAWRSPSGIQERLQSHPRPLELAAVPRARAALNRGGGEREAADRCGLGCGGLTPPALGAG